MTHTTRRERVDWLGVGVWIVGPVLSWGAVVLVALALCGCAPRIVRVTDFPGDVRVIDYADGSARIRTGCAAAGYREQWDLRDSRVLAVLVVGALAVAPHMAAR